VGSDPMVLTTKQLEVRGRHWGKDGGKRSPRKKKSEGLQTPPEGKQLAKEEETADLN